MNLLTYYTIFLLKINLRYYYSSSPSFESSFSGFLAVTHLPQGFGTLAVLSAYKDFSQVLYMAHNLHFLRIFAQM